MPKGIPERGLFSGVVNMLMLAGPLYMLQVYDRVLASRSVPTLIALSLFLVIAYAFQGGLDVVRSRLVVRIASLLDLRLEAGPRFGDPACEPEPRFHRIAPAGARS